MPAPKLFTTLPFASAAKMVVPLGTGDLDVGGGTVAAGLYNAVARGINIKIVADKGSIAQGYEYSTLLVRKDLDPALKEKIRQFFITYGTGTGPEADRQRQVLKKLTYGGFKPADDSYLDPIREMVAGDRIRAPSSVPPFSSMRQKRDRFAAVLKSPAWPATPSIRRAVGS